MQIGLRHGIDCALRAFLGEWRCAGERFPLEPNLVDTVILLHHCKYIALSHTNKDEIVETLTSAVLFIYHKTLTQIFLM